MSDLRELRLSKNLPVREMVEIVQPLYPKYDKVMQSKVENGEAYGVELRRDAMEALYKAFDPEKLSAKRKRKDLHRLTCRISCRLENDVYQKLMQMVRAEGYATMQEWLTAMIIDRVKGAES